jgi:Acetyltransferase (GNAT) domain
MSDMIHRAGNANDLEQLKDIWQECFRVGQDYFVNSMATMPGREWPDTRILEIDGKIVSLCNVYRFEIRFGHAVLSMGGIGDVATPVAYRRQGHSSRVLADAQKYMISRDCSISYLYSGLFSFYRRSGWVETFVRGVETYTWNEAASDVDIRPAKESDYAALREIYACLTQTSVGMPERSMEHWKTRTAQAEHRIDVAERNGTVVAYSVADVDPNHHGGVMEVACLPGQESAVGSLLSKLATQYIPSPDSPQYYNFRLPRLLEQKPLEVEKYDVLMSMVVDWDLFCQQMAPEFAVRLAGHSGRVALAIDNPTYPGGLLINDSKVESPNDTTPDATIDSDAFWALLTGRKRAEETTPDLDAKSQELINAAFPPVDFNFPFTEHF